MLVLVMADNINFGTTNREDEVLVVTLLKELEGVLRLSIQS
jgi:hypothetical protein